MIVRLVPYGTAHMRSTSRWPKPGADALDLSIW